MAIRMTKEEFEAKFGEAPALDSVQSVPPVQPTSQRMTQEEFTSKFGVKPFTETAPEVISEPAIVPEETGFFSGLKAKFGERRQRIQAGQQRAIKGEQTTAETVFQGLGEGVGGGFDIAIEGIKSIGRSVTPDKVEEKIKEVVKDRASLLFPDFKESPVGKALQLGVEKFEDLSPRQQDNIRSAMELIAIAPVTKIAGKGLEVLPKIVKDTGLIFKEVVKPITKLKTNIQTTLASKNVNPQLAASAERLFLEGTQRLDAPLATYEKYLTQSKKAITDIKVDPAVSVVGEKIGNEFNKVVSLRRSVGQAMADELKKVGTIETNTLGAVDDFVKELGDSGVVFDRVTKTVKAKTGQTKFAQSDIKLIENYAQQLQGLGTKSTIAELDAFLSRVSSEIDIYKSTNNIIGTTNAERIIKGSMSNLRKQFDPIATGNPALKAYSDARQSYSELTNFIQEGSGFLGKITQAGDFAKDASLTKSAVQSVLNNGKKDWLLRLEELTGYQAIDDAVLALQAMKDAGDFRGVSLLELMSASKTPVTPLGFADKLIDFGIEKGKSAFVGSPEQQTRLLLKQIQESNKLNSLPLK
jgi:hypothetical protein